MVKHWGISVINLLQYILIMENRVLGLNPVVTGGPSEDVTFRMSYADK